MKILALLSFCWLLASPDFGQEYPHFSLNSGVTTTTPESKAILMLWDAYLGAKPEHKQEFWAPDELTSYPGGDILRSEGYVSPNIYYFGSQKVVLSVGQIDSALYQCKTMFYWKTPAGTAEQLNVLCTINTLFRPTQGRWYLVNYLSYYTRHWHTEIVGNIAYHLPPGRALDRSQAELAQGFLSRVFSDFDIPPFQVTYYLAQDCAEVARMKGFDYVLGLGTSQVCGFYDQVNHLVYAGGQGEQYLHELTHVINPYFPKAHSLFLTGYAGLRGGHFGHDLAYHKRRVQTYLASHPVDLANPLFFNSLDDQTNPQYVIGGLFCELALRQGGVAKLKRLFSYGTTDEDFFRALQAEFKLNRKNLDGFIRKQLPAAR